MSPAYHRIHHSAEGPNDVNLGTVLTVWDLLAHKAVFPNQGAVVIDTGIAGRPLPLEQRGERRRYIPTLAAQLAEPFVDQRQMASSDQGR